MFMEGEVDWVLVLGLVAAAASIIAVLAVAFAISNRTRQVSTSDELGAVSKAREAAEAQLYETLHAVPVALVQTDRAGKFVFANRAAHQLMGRRDAELIGLRFHSATWGISYPDGRPIPADLLPSARALRGQTVKGFQHILANPATRRKMLVSATAMPIEDAQGQVIGSMAALVETESLITPEALEPETTIAPGDDLVRRVFEAASSPLVVVSAHGLIREANPVALDMFGRTSDVIGVDFADQFLSEGERAVGRQALRAAIAAPAGEAEAIVSTFGDEQGIVWRILQLNRPDEAVEALLLAGDVLQPAVVIETVEAEASGTPAADTDPLAIPPFDAIPDSRVTPTPEPAALEQAIAREALLLAELESARTQLEVERAAAIQAARDARAEALAEAETSNEVTRRLESVGRLTGGVAQDFNALLAVMTSALDMMLKTAEDPTRVRRLGQAALAAGQRGEALTRRLSAFSQGEQAQAQVLDVGVLLRALESRLRALAGLGVDLMIETPAAPVPVRIDPVGFDGSVEALVRNAAEAMKGSGAIAVRLQAPSAGDAEGEARVTVRDTGPGLDPATAARALEPFFTTREGAAGLGLAQVHAFARQSRGALSLSAVEGEGLEAILTLPVAAPTLEPEEAG